jgi:hypothetical protein
MPGDLRYIRKIKAEKEIRDFLNAANKVVYHAPELEEIIERHRGVWNLAPTTHVTKLLERFVRNDIFKIVELDLSNGKKQMLYLFGNPSPFDIAAGIRSKSYLSHYSAVFLHGLTEQVPKTLYVTQEQSEKIPAKSTLTQEDIDRAFSQPQRRSMLQTQYEDYNIVLLNGKYTNRQGVMDASRLGRVTGHFNYTNLERTLIDIAVRPNYAGGAFAVLRAYQAALSESFSGNRLNALLANLHFIYPYQQAIGFYLDKAGFSGPWLDKLRNHPMKFDFYLDYAITEAEREYSPEWKIYYPKGI